MTRRSLLGALALLPAGTALPAPEAGEKSWLTEGDWSPVRRLLALGTSDGRITLSPDGRKYRAESRGHTGQVLGLAWSRDGRRLASCGEDGIAIVWDANLRERLHSVKGNGYFYDLEWLSGDRLLLASEEGTLLEWEIRTGGKRELFRTHFPLYWLALQPGGRRVATVDGESRVWVLNTAGEPKPRQLRGPHGLDFNVNLGLAWSRSGRFLAAGGTAIRNGEPNLVQVWDMHTGRSTRFGPELVLRRLAMAWRNDDRHLLVLCAGSLYEFEYEPGGTPRAPAPLPVSADRFLVRPEDGSLVCWGTGHELVIIPDA